MPHDASPSIEQPRPSRRTRRPAPALHPGQQGYSLIEVLIAAAMLLVITLGMLPLFTQSLINNAAGSDYTNITNFAKSEAESFDRLPFLGAGLQIPAGKTQLVVDEYLDPASNQWKAWPPPGTNPLVQWRRTTTYRQYNIHDLDDDGVFNNPLDGKLSDTTNASYDANAVQVKEATVQVQNIAAVGPFGGRRQTTFRFLRAF
ncbi:MAG TPA: prepilin-type N-terminal cleavage/methylation domain-containing protein [Thermoanaerobaculia bacterium]|nr:prepilin-type N-terminal cleavage/methylation domain-containing protein [Thermoanaerobaculia bacterium]